MTRYKHSRLIDALCISALIGVSACSQQQEADVSSLLSDTEITFSLSEWTPIVQSRAAIFEGKDSLWLDPRQGGGNFTLYAYTDATAETYINGVRGWYFKELGEWWMLDGNKEPVTYYWPNSAKLNFFAYMPDSKYNDSDGYKSKPTYVTIDSYTKDSGQTFSCALPSKVSNAASTDDFVANSEIQEFIYAYETDKEKQIAPVELHFKHPFALINFRLKSGSYRMTIHNFTFDTIHLNGKFSTKTGEWSLPSDEGKTSYIAGIDKRVPGSDDNNPDNNVNYNSNLSDWFVVLPQDLTGVTLTLNATRTLENTSESNKNDTIKSTYSFKDGDKWEPGYRYIYTISHGDNQEEIYFNVEVEKWEKWEIGYEHNIDVE